MTRSSMLALVVLLAASAGAEDVCAEMNNENVDITAEKICSKGNRKKNKEECNKAYLVEGVGKDRKIQMCKWNEKKTKKCINQDAVACPEGTVCQKVTNQDGTWQNPDMVQSTKKKCKKEKNKKKCTNSYIAKKPNAEGKAMFVECALKGKKCADKPESKKKCTIPTLCQKIGWNSWPMMAKPACKKSKTQTDCLNTYFTDKDDTLKVTGCKWKSSACKTDSTVKETCDPPAADGPRDGDCSITPETGGIAVTTSFEISTSGWETTDPPLSYTFIVYDSSMTRPDDVTTSSSDTCASDICERVFRFKPSDEVSKTLILPQGSWKIGCKATDNSGNSAEETAEVEVEAA